MRHAERVGPLNRNACSCTRRLPRSVHANDKTRSYTVHGQRADRKTRMHTPITDANFRGFRPRRVRQTRAVNAVGKGLLAVVSRSITTVCDPTGRRNDFTFGDSAS